MFVEHKEQGEVTEAPAKTLRASGALRLGMSIVKEDARIYLSSEYCGCAVAMAAVASGFTYAQKVSSGGWTSIYDHLAANFPEVPLAVWRAVDDDHACERKSAAQCADWLESQGY